MPTWPVDKRMRRNLMNFDKLTVITLTSGVILDIGNDFDNQPARILISEKPYEYSGYQNRFIQFRHHQRHLRRGDGFAVATKPPALA
jgi:hypothetical protein